MKKQMDAGLSLRPREQTAPALLRPLADGLLTLGGLLVLLEAVCGWVSTGNPLLTLACALLGTVLAAAGERFSTLRTVRLLLPGVCLLTAIVANGSIFSGWQKVYASACTILTRARGRLFLPRAGDGAQDSAVLFCCVMTLLLALLCSRLACKSRRLCGVGLCILTAGAVLLLQPEKGQSWMAAGLLFALVLLPDVPKDKKDRQLLPELALLLLVPMLLALVSGLVPAWREEVLSARLGESAREWLHQLRYEREDSVLPEGDLSQAWEKPAGSDTRLVVTMEQPEALYLRGFTGDVLENSRWSAFSRETLAEHSDLIYWLHRAGFDPRSQLWTAVQTMEALPETQTITIENIGGCSAWVYIPCGLAGAGEQVQDVLSLESSALSARGWNGARQYTLQVLTQPEKTAHRVVEYYQNHRDAGQDYLSAEGSWRAFLTEQSLAVPQEALTLLKPLLDQCCEAYGDPSSLTPEEAQRSTLAFLDTYVTKREADGPALPLDDTMQGTEYQTATLTVLALRYYGIPARYAEGFVLTEAQAQKAQPGEPILLDDTCAHPWAEVYQDGAGWLPLELTPGYTLLLDTISQETQQQTGLSGNGTGSAASLPEAQEPDEETPDAPQQTEDPTETPQMQGLPLKTLLLLAVLALLLVLLLLLAIIALRYRVRSRQRTRQFSQENHAEAICQVGLALDRLLPRLELDRKGGSFYSLCQPAETLEPGYGGALEQMARYHGEALFSSHPMTAEQADWARQFWKRTVALLPRRQNGLRRLWLKWILCMY